MSGFLLIDGDWGGRGLGGIWFVDVWWWDCISPTGKWGFLAFFNKCLSPTGYCLGLWVPLLRNDKKKGNEKNRGMAEKGLDAHKLLPMAIGMRERGGK